VNRGAVYGKLGQYDRALEDFNKGIELGPDALDGYLNRSLLFTQLNKLALAIADL
jgi:tetratricopeptide (TPR) repeat protein